MVCGDFVGKESLGFADGFKVGNENEGTKVILIGEFEGFEVMGLLDGSGFGNKVGFDIDGDFREGFTVGCRIGFEVDGLAVGS